jgi:hypothetical protein
MERKTNPCIHASRERDFSFLEKMRGRASNVYQAAHSIVLTLTHKDLFLLISGYTESRKRSIVLARSVRRPLSLIQRRRSLGKMDSSIVIKVKICKLNTVLIGSQDNTSYKVIRLYKIRSKMKAVKLIRYYLINFLYNFSVYAL